MRACLGSATHASGISYPPKAITEQQFYVEMRLQIELSTSSPLAFRFISVCPLLAAFVGLLFLMAGRPLYGANLAAPQHPEVVITSSGSLHRTCLKLQRSQKT
jgi:hypothetical protein